MRYWAIDYVNGEAGECELVLDDQLYATMEAAMEARRKLRRPELYEVSWYTYPDLQELYNKLDVKINEKLQVVGA